MSYAYHRRLNMAEPFAARAARWPFLAAAWAALLLIDCILFLIGFRWSALRNASRLDW